MFARNRGTIWKKVKQVTGMGDTMMEKYKATVLGLEELPKPLPSGWGFDAQGEDGTDASKDEGKKSK